MSTSSCVSISPRTRCTDPGPLKNVSSGVSLGPWGENIRSLAPSAMSMGALSADGAALQRFPPMVARFLTWYEPIFLETSASAGRCCRMTGDTMMSLNLASAPM